MDYATRLLARALTPVTPPPQALYTCAQLLGIGGEVELVACLTPQLGGEELGEELKKRPPPLPDVRAENGVSADLN